VSGGTRSTRPLRVLVIGWGFIGQAIGRRLLAEDNVVRALTPNPVALPPEVEFLKGRAEGGPLSRAVRDVDHVVWCAGGSLPLEAEKNPLDDAAATILPVIAALDELRRHPGVGLTYISSGGTVYGNPEQNPVPETAPLQPLSAYGISRMTSELYIRKYGASHDVPVNVARCSNVYGPGQPANRGQGAIAVFLDKLTRKLPVTIYGDGGTVRDYVHVDDVATAISQLIAGNLHGETVNVGSGHGHSTLQVLETICTATGIPAIVDYKPSRDHEVRSIVLDIARLQSLIAYRPRSLAAGIETLVAQKLGDDTATSDVA
jgi:UDP-glucose 4-epimerase